MKCKHENIEFLEVHEDAISYIIEEDGDITSADVGGEYLRTEIICHDCGKNWRFNKNSPKFIKEKYKMIIDYLENS